MGFALPSISSRYPPQAALMLVRGMPAFASSSIALVASARLSKNPPEIQLVQVFSAAVVVGSREIEASKQLIEFLASARASEAIRNSGMEPLVPSR